MKLKRITSLIIAIALMICAIPLGAYAEGDEQQEPADSGATKPKVEIIGSLIKDDDQFMELTLKVTPGSKGFSTMGVVLQYDKTVITPVAWDSSGTEVSMTGHTGWDEPAFIPAYSPAEITGRVALGYEDPTENSTAGYIYLNPESSLHLTNLPDSGKILTVRFKYVGADEAAQAESKAKLTAEGAAAVNGTVLSLAPDSIAAASAAFQQVFYSAGDEDFTEYYYSTDPENTTGAKPDGGLIDEPAISLVEAETGTVGKSLSLDDVSAIMFYDWDDSFLGAATVMRGSDARQVVNEYVKNHFIHTDLRGQTGETLASTARNDNYRGSELSNEPDKRENGDGVTVEDGASYPLTNKLDYIFYGKTIDADYPYVSGWKQVEPMTMSDTWTALSDKDFQETTDPETGEPVENENLKTYDFSKITDDVIYVKAMYAPGEGLNKTSTEGDLNYDYTFSELEYLSINQADATSGAYSATMTAKRINPYGYGSTRLTRPVLRVYMQPSVEGASRLLFQIDMENKDVAEVMMNPVYGISNVTYQCLDLLTKYTVANGESHSVVYEFSSNGWNDFIRAGTWNKIHNAIKKAHDENDTGDWGNINAIAFNNAKLQNTGGANIAAGRSFNTLKNNVLNLGKKLIDQYGDVTWEQIQYGILNSYADVDQATAESYCQGQDWYKKDIS